MNNRNCVVQLISGEFIAESSMLLTTPFVAFAQRYTRERALHVWRGNPARSRVCELTVLGFYDGAPSPAFRAAA